MRNGGARQYEPVDVAAKCQCFNHTSYTDRASVPAVIIRIGRQASAPAHDTRCISYHAPWDSRAGGHCSRRLVGRLMESWSIKSFAPHNAVTILPCNAVLVSHLLACPVCRNIVVYILGPFPHHSSIMPWPALLTAPAAEADPPSRPRAECISECHSVLIRPLACSTRR